MVKASVVAAAADVADQDVEVGMFEVSLTSKKTNQPYSLTMWILFVIVMTMKLTVVLYKEQFLTASIRGEQI